MSTWGLLVRFFGGMAAGIAAVAIALGCAAATQPRPHVDAGSVLGAGQERGAWASPAEVAWLAKLGRWEARLLRSLARASTSRSTADAAQLLEPVQSCRDDLRTDVGEPPTTRLQAALDLIERACAHLEHAADASSDAAADVEGHDGGKLLLAADQLLPPGESRSLPVIAGASTRSHVDPTFGAVASDLAAKHVEVRCWSRVDWTRLLHEEKAYTLHHIDNNTLGFAGVHGARANLSPEICDSLGELRYGGWHPTAPDAELLLATAVVTLTHEAQHTKGIAAEAQAECNAIQLMTHTAVSLGATPTYAASLQRLYWAHYDEELPSYRSPECRDGGAYDLDRSDRHFP